MKTKLNKILLLYFHVYKTVRSSSQALLNCFDEYTSAKVYYVNVAYGVPSYIENIEFDLIIYGEMLMTKRNIPSRFDKIRSRTFKLRSLNALKLAFVQDEMSYTYSLNEYINEQNIDIVYSVAPPSEITKIYSEVDQTKVKFRHMLTGYLDDKHLEHIAELNLTHGYRPIKVGYRANYARRYSLGSHGLLKFQIGELFKKICAERKWTCDISMETSDSILGDDWYRFLAGCEFTIGAESGASVLDPKGHILEAVSRYLKLNPSSEFEEVKSKLFAKEDGKLALFALGPRHLEACALKTCQVLYEGDYNGVLRPDVHYISLKQDHSNLSDVISMMENPLIRDKIVNSAYEDIVASKKYHFSTFVKQVVSDCEAQIGQGARSHFLDGPFFLLNKAHDKMSWILVKTTTLIFNVVSKFIKL